MISPTASTASPSRTVSPHPRQLEALVGIAVEMAAEQYQALANRLSCALIDASDGDSDTTQRSRRAGNLLCHRQVAFIDLATAALDKALRREVVALSMMSESVGGQAPTLAPCEDGEDGDDGETKAATADIVRTFDLLHSDALQTLNVRLAFLLDRRILRVGENPFRPQVFLSSLQQAWMAFLPEPEATPMLLPLIKPGIGIELGPLFNALNLALQTRSPLSAAVGGHQCRRSDAALAVPHDPPFEAMRRGVHALIT